MEFEEVLRKRHSIKNLDEIIYPVRKPRRFLTEFTKNTKKRDFFIGIDLGGKEKKTTGVCILEKDGGPFKNYCQKS